MTDKESKWIKFCPSFGLPKERVSIAYDTHDERGIRYAYGYFQFHNGTCSCFWKDGNEQPKAVKVDDIKYWMPIPSFDSLQEEPEEHDVCRFCEKKDSCVDTCFVKLTEKQRYPMSIAEKMYRELPVTINGKIEWYDCPFLNYNEEEFFQAIEKMMLKIGDNVKIMISKEQ